MAYGVAVTAMLLVSPVTWEYSIPLLLVPIAVITRAAAESRRISVPLALILAALSLPQGQLMAPFLVGRTIPDASPAFVLGPLSIKFYALLAIFAWGSPPSGPRAGPRRAAKARRTRIMPTMRRRCPGEMPR